LVESKSVARSELETNYATKAELRSNYLTKSDGQIVYAKKSDLDTNYATKADLRANYLTKSDANTLELRCASKAYVDQELNILRTLIGKFPLIAGSPLKGIINHLTLEFGGNVHDRGVVAITADRPCSSHPIHAAKNIADLEADSFFDSSNARDMWVCYDFKTLKVALTDYSIRSRYNDIPRNLKSWVIEVSNDGANWTEADRRENRDELCAENVVGSFAVSRPSTGRYVRLRQTGLNNDGNFDTYISGFELFGALLQ
jgi:hypothetical protein